MQCLRCFYWSSFEGPLKTGFTVGLNLHVSYLLFTCKNHPYLPKNENVHQICCQLQSLLTLKGFMVYRATSLNAIVFFSLNVRNFLNIM